MEHVFNSEENKQLHNQNVREFFNAVAHSFWEFAEELKNNPNPKGEVDE